jgi:hypothetical protein
MGRYSLGGGGGDAAVTALNNATENEIVTVGSTTTELEAEATLTFASNKLIPTASAHNAAGTALTLSSGATTAGTTNNIAGGALTIQGGQGKGSGAGGDIIFQTANAGGSGSSLNALATALTISDDLSATFAGNIELGHASDTTLSRSSGGVVTIEGNIIKTVGTEDMWVPATAMRPASTNGCAAITDVETTATRPDMQVLDFDSSTQEYAQFSVAMPKSWNEGTVTAQFYWTHATAVSTDVIWGIQGLCVSDNDTIDTTYGTAQTVTDTFHNTAEDLAVTAATSAITLAGSPAAGDLAFFQVYRDADAGGDTTNSTDARLIGVKINYTTNATNDA